MVFVQFGDYAEAVYRFEAGGAETYYAQKYSVDYVAGLVARLDTVTVVTCSRSFPFEKLSSGVGALGVKLYPRGQRARHAELISAVEALDPTDLIIGAPLHRLIRWALRRETRVLSILADSFQALGFRPRIREFLLRWALNDSRIVWVANPASLPRST